MSKTSLTLFTILLVISQLSADGRRYVWTYEYLTMPKGEAEIETYTDFQHVDTDSGRLSSTTLQYEYEIGMNDRYDVGIYQKFTQSPGSPLTYDGFKVRMRYRLGEKGKWPLDPLIYLEYKDTPAFDHSTLETKIILARDMGSFNVALNPVLELELYGDETEIEFEYTAAFGYRLHPLLNLALETKGSADALYWGPTISHGKEDLWFGLGMLFPTSESSSPDRKLRLIIGVGL